MKEVKKVSSGAEWEDIVGYSRAVKVGNVIEVAGTTAPGANEYEQTIAIIKIAEKALKELDADLSNVVRTRIYCTNITNWENIGKAHGEFFKEIKPAATMVEVSKLISPDILVEIEFSAIV
ncbi:RidA family protein [Aquimarina gracilis]|uniref:RidA family protein n=1 Tax=Aquimarina gracilis TaxID=874422 RepID=A0ABU5ZXH7_9FLAO|nr:RidA family protein [Aquimarina gracilis]MEB3346562.1 RidA family protein [Aquimarina gracilis]